METIEISSLSIPSKMHENIIHRWLFSPWERCVWELNQFSTRLGFNWPHLYPDTDFKTDTPSNCLCLPWSEKCARFSRSLNSLELVTEQLNFLFQAVYMNNEIEVRPYSGRAFIFTIICNVVRVGLLDPFLWMSKLEWFQKPSYLHMGIAGIHTHSETNYLT